MKTVNQILEIATEYKDIVSAVYFLQDGGAMLNMGITDEDEDAVDEAHRLLVNARDSKHGGVVLNGQIYMLLGQAEPTASITDLPFHSAKEGEEYKFEMGSDAIDLTGERVRVYWDFVGRKGEEVDYSDYDYSIISRVN